MHAAADDRDMLAPVVAVDIYFIITRDTVLRGGYSWYTGSASRQGNYKFIFRADLPTDKIVMKGHILTGYISEIPDLWENEYQSLYMHISNRAPGRRRGTIIYPEVVLNTRRSPWKCVLPVGRFYRSFYIFFS